MALVLVYMTLFFLRTSDSTWWEQVYSLLLRAHWYPPLPWVPCQMLPRGCLLQAGWPKRISVASNNMPSYHLRFWHRSSPHDDFISHLLWFFFWLQSPLYGEMKRKAKTSCPFEYGRATKYATFSWEITAVWYAIPRLCTLRVCLRVQHALDS